MNHPHYRITLNEGYSQLFAKTAESVPYDLKDYVKDLKSDLS